jgi:hypothetical protein
MTQEEANAMTREEITATLRAIDIDSDHDSYMAACMFIPAADLIDQQAARIAELEAELVVRWCSGRDAAATEAINAIDNTYVLTPEHETLGDRVAEAIRALTPPETQP